MEGWRAPCYHSSQMTYKIEFQYKPTGQTQPFDYVQKVDIRSTKGDFIPVPNVGDSVACDFEGKLKAYKVLTRHFSYSVDLCAVNIVVTDLAHDELAARLKE